MTPVEFGPLHPVAPRPRVTLEPVLSDWRVQTLDLGTRRAMACWLTLCCGHQIPLAIAYPEERHPATRGVADANAKYKLQSYAVEVAAEHDCAAYVRQQALAKVTARLKQ